MSEVVNLLNQLVRTALEARPPGEGSPFQPSRVELTPGGARVEGRLAHEQARGDVALDLDVREPETGKYVLSLSVRESPEQLGPWLEPFRGVLERLEADIRLDFETPEGTRR
jgi:hypothetical protein